MNLADVPPLLCSGLLTGVAGWFVLRRRDRPGIWAAAGLFGLAAYPVAWMIAVAAGVDPSGDRTHSRVAALAVDGFLGLLFAAVVVDRRGEAGRE